MSTIGDISNKTKWIVSKRYVQAAIVVSLMTLVIVLPFVTRVFALTDIGNAGVFQLDGTIHKTASTTFPTNWDALFSSSGTSLPLPPGGLSSGFVNDAITPDTTVYTTGSKDTLNIANNGWQCTAKTTVTDKDKILDVYSFAIIPSSGSRAGHLLIYAGYERFANSGAGNIGIWLLGDPTVNCSGANGITNFNGTHVNNDLLVTAAFSTGGSVTTLDAFNWVGGASGFLNTTAITGTDCQTASITANFCARSNSATIKNIPWPLQDKTSNTSSTLQTAEFFEVGIDLNGFFGQNPPCVNRFLFDSRSSPSPTADLHDFAVGSLQTCPHAKITTNVSPRPIALGGSSMDTATVTLTQATATVLGSVTFNVYGPFASAPTSTSCTAGSLVTPFSPNIKSIGPVTGSSSVTSDSFTPAVAGYYGWIATYNPSTLRNGNTNSTMCGDTGETLLVIASSITTKVSPTPITLGGSSADTATVTVTSGGTVGGNVVFNAYASLSDCNSGTNSKFTDTEPVSGSSPQSVTSTAFTPTAPGTYYWKAAYGPTGAINGPSALSTCGDSNEIVVVSGIPKITAFGYTNSPTNNDPTLGSGTVTYSFTIHNYGASPVTVSGSLTSTGSTASVTACTGNGLAFSGVSLAAFGSAGDSATFTVTCSYSGAGLTVQANLTATFTVPPNATPHPVSGSPATISFTVQTS